MDIKLFLGLIKSLDVCCSGTVATATVIFDTRRMWVVRLTPRPFSRWTESTATDKRRLREPHHRTGRSGEEKIQASLIFPLPSQWPTRNKLIIIYEKFHKGKKRVGVA